MPLPEPWTPQDQYRAETLDRELVQALKTVRRAIVAAKGLKERFVAGGYSARWPTLTADYVHQEPDASTRAEQNDAGLLIDYLRAKLLADGASTSLTDAQAAAFLSRYAG